MKLSQNKRELLRIAIQYCDEEDKSTEFMIQYMQDFADATFDEVMYFLKEINHDNE